MRRLAVLIGVIVGLAFPASASADLTAAIFEQSDPGNGGITWQPGTTTIDQPVTYGPTCDNNGSTWDGLVTIPPNSVRYVTGTRANGYENYVQGVGGYVDAFHWHKFLRYDTTSAYTAEYTWVVHLGGGVDSGTKLAVRMLASVVDVYGITHSLVYKLRNYDTDQPAIYAKCSAAYPATTYAD